MNELLEPDAPVFLEGNKSLTRHCLVLTRGSGWQVAFLQLSRMLAVQPVLQARLGSAGSLLSAWANQTAACRLRNLS